MALTFAGQTPWRLLIVPALFDEAPRLRRFTVEVMRRLAGAGIASALPDLPGTNESLAPLAAQTLGDWRLAMLGAARHFGATHVLSVCGGALIAPATLPGWRYAPVSGGTLLRTMLRARLLAAREAGRDETSEALLARGKADGLVLAGLAIGASCIAELTDAIVPDAAQRDITHEQLGVTSGGLWLRAEPGEDAAQADALAAIVAVGLKAGPP